MRRFAYARYSEARAAHWLLLLAADRVDVLESRARRHPVPAAAVVLAVGAVVAAGVRVRR